MGGDKRCVRDQAPLDHALFSCLKRFLPEEACHVSQEMSFKFDDLDIVHTPPPSLSKFSHQVCKNPKDQLSEKVGGLGLAFGGPQRVMKSILNAIDLK